MRAQRIHFLASPGKAGQSALAAMKKRYGQAARDESTVIVALGGDGFMLQTLQVSRCGRPPRS